MNNMFFNVYKVRFHYCYSRMKEKLLHILEIDPNLDKNNKSEVYSNRMVKSFCRSAAGKNMQSPKQLRPTAVLLKTIHYLLKEY